MKSEETGPRSRGPGRLFSGRFKTGTVETRVGHGQAVIDEQDCMYGLSGKIAGAVLRPDWPGHGQHEKENGECSKGQQQDISQL